MICRTKVFRGESSVVEGWFMFCRTDLSGYWLHMLCFSFDLEIFVSL